MLVLAWMHFLCWQRAQRAPAGKAEVPIRPVYIRTYVHTHIIYIHMYAMQARALAVRPSAWTPDFDGC